MEPFSGFYIHVSADLEETKGKRGMEVKLGRSANFVPISILPWRSFTSVASGSKGEYILLFPVFTCGKWQESRGHIKIPLAINIFHGSADGYHLAKFYNDLEEICAYPQWAEK